MGYLEANTDDLKKPIHQNRYQTHPSPISLEVIEDLIELAYPDAHSVFPHFVGHSRLLVQASTLVWSGEE